VTPDLGTIVVVEDDANIADLVDMYLRQAGFRVTVADTTPPVLRLPADRSIQATGSNGARVDYSATATDSVDGSLEPEVCEDAYLEGDRAFTPGTAERLRPVMGVA